VAAAAAPIQIDLVAPLAESLALWNVALDEQDLAGHVAHLFRVVSPIETGGGQRTNR